MQVAKEIRVVDHARYLVLRAEPAAAAHPSDECTVRNGENFGSSHAGAVRLVIEIAQGERPVEAPCKSVPF